MASEKFRRQLRQESEVWWREGLIDAQLYETLATRYQFRDIEVNARSQFTTILISLGGILLGLGVITFVAANWTVWSREVKVVLLMATFFAINTIGFYLWRSPSENGLKKLGAALLLLGGLTLGANISLVSQMFHQSGELYELFLVWGLAVWVMALSLAMPALSMLSVLLLGFGYLRGMMYTIMAQDLTIYHLAILHMPLLSIALILPLAHRSRSRITFGLGALLFSLSFLMNLTAFGNWRGEMAIVLPAALVWAYSVQSPKKWIEPSFQSIARKIALIWLAVVFYVLSFNAWTSVSISPEMFRVSWGAHLLVDIILCSTLTIWLWLKLCRQWSQFSLLQERSLNTGVILVMLVLTAGSLYTHLNLVPLVVLAPLLFNILFFVLSIAAIRDGLALGSRRSFWSGMILLIIGIMTRTLEYNTGLMTKAVVFAACGVGVILAGLWFERNIHHHASMSHPQLQEHNS
ncbi:DUF2157 domain-containing protein [Geitlerinema sp. P-1104]|uniref:DUF2157 domain-containing protein n=1 Tax=Geitlerinema sp. P-1104 TaxID=2546230 RepID=UPI001476E1EA|nr:DUF2157 domain-containing protein [Geitlerinema sp. P-1104]NMG58504.1 DUF2157 domain-containing protein [Geitlerinema sp. P-1104]